jgi:glycosyltransferase involved in cell wall biosynthesis
LPRVCFVVTLASATSRYGGPFDVVREQSALVGAAGSTVEVVAGWTAGDRAASLSGVRSSFRQVRPWLPTKDFTGLLSWAILRQLWVSIGRADVVHVSFAREAVPVAAVAVALVRRRIIVAQPHGMLTSRTSRAHDVIDALLRPLLRRVHHWVALTTTEQRDLRLRFGPSVRDISVIGNPVPIDDSAADRLQELGATPDGSAVFIARLHPRKRVLDFAAAAAVAENNGWSERYRVIGPDQGDLAALLRRVEVLPNLIYEGQVDSSAIPALLAGSSAFVLASRDEPWGNALATSVTLGVPSVLTRSSALAEVLDGRPGVHVVEDGDAVAIAAAVHESVEHGHVDASDLFGRATVQHALLQVYRSARWRGTAA